MFRFWCSGRICCEGMLVELRLLKRQDLVGVISNLMKPAHDQIHVRVDMSPEDMDSFIFCIASKNSARCRRNIASSAPARSRIALPTAASPAVLRRNLFRS